MTTLKQKTTVIQTKMANFPRPELYPRKFQQFVLARKVIKQAKYIFQTIYFQQRIALLSIDYT